MSGNFRAYITALHIPTGEVASSDIDRSQHQNRARCIKILRSRLWALQNGYTRPDPNFIIEYYDPEDMQTDEDV